MAFRKRTLRTMSPTARKVARLAGELDSVANRLKNLIPELQCLDSDSKVMFERMTANKVIIVSDEMGDETIALLKKLNPNHILLSNKIEF